MSQFVTETPFQTDLLNRLPEDDLLGSYLNVLAGGEFSDHPSIGAVKFLFDQLVTNCEMSEREAVTLIDNSINGILVPVVSTILEEQSV